ncbi:MAG: hypothetical protein P4L99_02625 [Chthoniobacter sp.]|nr:hypothetical protein [Chthoniobacter sp.]
MFPPKKLAILLGILVVLNLLRFWPREHSSDGWTPAQQPFLDNVGAPPDGAMLPGGDPVMRQRMAEALQKLPAEQRKAVESRIAADRAFFDSLRGLPEEERREKVRDYFAQNPPLAGIAPPGMAGGGPPGNLPEGDPPGDMVHLPPPALRRSLDQQIANSQQKANGS